MQQFGTKPNPLKIEGVGGVDVSFTLFYLIGNF